MPPYRRHNRKHHPPPVTNIQFQEFNDLLVVAWISDRRQWLCQCRCGRFVISKQRQLTTGEIKSCGHLHTPPPDGKKMYKYFRKLWPEEFRAWQEILDGKLMRKRVCRRWVVSFNAFREDVGTIKRGQSIGKVRRGVIMGPDNFRIMKTGEQVVKRASDRDKERIRQAMKDSGLTRHQLGKLFKPFPKLRYWWMFIDGLHYEYGPEKIQLFADLLGVELLDQ